LTTGDASMLAGLPGLIALIVCLRRGPIYAFLNVYLPVLLLLPDDYRMPISGQLSFSESAILPIALFYLWNGWRDWKWSFTDGLVLAFVSMMSLAEYVNTDFALAKNLALHAIMAIIFPYMMAKALMGREELAVQVGKRIVLFATLVAVISVYEFRMTLNPFLTVVAPFFPAKIADVTSFRYNWVRISGPWTHPILAAIILAIAYRIVRWLDWTGYWPGNVPFLPIRKVRFCELALLVGSAMTLSRGPWIAAAVAAVIVMLVRARNRALLAAMLVFAVVIVGVPGYFSFESYVSVDRGKVQNEAQQSAAYRREMMNDYVAIAEQRPMWGWGQNNIGQGLYPIVEGMVSIDNHYLLVALNFGIYALALLVLMLLWVPVRLFRFSLRRSRDDPALLLGVTLAGLFVLCAISISTVYLGAQTQPLLFLIAGWSEALLVTPMFMTAKVPVPSRSVTYRFERVMV
jgi:O-antigen ligase